MIETFLYPTILGALIIGIITSIGSLLARIFERFEWMEYIVPVIVGGVLTLVFCWLIGALALELAGIFS